MADLQNISGASLVPNIQPFTSGIAGIFQQRRTEQEKATKTQQLLEIATQAGTGDPQALARLALFNPQAATAVSQALERNNQAELKATQEQSEQSVRNAIGVQSTPFNQRPAEFIRLAQEARQQGDIPGAENILRIANLPEPEQNLELQKIVIQNDDIARVTERATARNALATANTIIGKARQDLQNKLITEDEFNILAKTPSSFVTETGKLIADKQAAIELFGQGSEQVKLMDAAIDSSSKGEAPDLSDTAGIRKEFTKLSGDFITMRDAIGKVAQAGLNPSPAGDLSLIFNFMKIQDPGSVVRESEFATAQNATSLVGRLGAGAQRVVNGERMLPEQRQDFIDTANRLFQSQKRNQKALEQQFSGIAQRAGIDPQDVIIDFDTIQPQALPENPGDVSTGERTPEGFPIFRRLDGSTYAISP